jgi:hypothetical protein
MNVRTQPVGLQNIGINKVETADIKVMHEEK